MSRKENYKNLAFQYWNQEYKTLGWPVVHNAGNKEKTINLAIREIDLFLEPTKEKVHELLNDKENNPIPTFTSDFYKHPSISDYLDLKNSVAVDYGCGALARYTTALAKKFKFVYGFDISSEAIKLAKQEISKTDIRNIALIQNNGIQISLPSFSVDFIFSNLVLQHIGNIDVNYKLAEEFVRILKPGGLMRLEYLDGSQRKEDNFEHPAEGNGITQEDLYKMYSEKCQILMVTEEHPWLWVTIKKNGYV